MFICLQIRNSSSSSVSRATRLRTEGPERPSSIPGRRTEISLLQVVEHRSGIHPACCPLCTCMCRFFPAIKLKFCGLKSSSCLNLWPRLRMRHAKPSPLHKTSWCGTQLSTGGTLTLLKACHSNQYVYPKVVREILPQRTCFRFWVQN
jgi:hypothetical protein